MYDKLPYVLALIAFITFLLLVRTFRSVLLPLKAVLLNLISLAATFGAMVFFWQKGHGSDAVFNISATGSINFWLPVVIFAFLFGLSMDYEVFIMARMREEYDRTGDTSKAVITGISRTGRLVTSAALILFFAFSALASSPGTDVKVLGTALGVGHPHRRHHRPRPARAGTGQLVRPMELVAAELARPRSCSSKPHRSRHAYRPGSIRILSRSGHRSGSARALLRADDAARDARNPHLCRPFS